MHQLTTTKQMDRPKKHNHFGGSNNKHYVHSSCYRTSTAGNKWKVEAFTTHCLDGESDFWRSDNMSTSTLAA